MSNRLITLFLDSYLKQFKLFTDADKLLRDYNSDFGDTDDESLDEHQAVSLFNDFLNLAKVLDTYQSWTQENWTNFMMFMVQAFKEKGKGIAINCALAALGITTSEPVTVEDIWINEETGEEQRYMPSDITGWKFVTRVNMKIKTIYTPIIGKFLEELESLLPRLLWIHGDGEMGEALIEQVLIEVKLSETYEKLSTEKAVYYSEIDLDA